MLTILALPDIFRGRWSCHSSGKRVRLQSTIYCKYNAECIAQALGWSYDVSKISILYFMTAGTKQADAGNEKNTGIAPLCFLQGNYEAISETYAKAYARCVNADHGDMLVQADGYMTAWFMHYQKDDVEKYFLEMMLKY